MSFYAVFELAVAAYVFVMTWRWIRDHQHRDWLRGYRNGTSMQDATDVQIIRAHERGMTTVHHLVSRGIPALLTAAGAYAAIKVLSAIF